MHYLEFVPVRGEKKKTFQTNFQNFKTVSWYLLEVLSKIYNNNHSPLNMRFPPPPPASRSLIFQFFSRNICLGDVRCGCNLIATFSPLLIIESPVAVSG